MTARPSSHPVTRVVTDAERTIMDHFLSALFRYRWRLAAAAGLALLAGCDPVALEATATAWWQVWAPVAVVVLASVVTALTRYPRAAGVVPLLQVLLDLLSVLAHRDSPATTKLPGTRSPRPDSAQDAPPPSSGAAGPALLLLATTALLGASACAPGLDGYRQAIGNAANVSASVADTVRQVSTAREQQARAELAAGRPAAEVAAELQPWRRAIDDARVALAGLDVTLTAAQGAIALADTGQRSDVDVGALVAQLVAQALDVQRLIAALSSSPPPVTTDGGTDAAASPALSDGGAL